MKLILWVAVYSYAIALSFAKGTLYDGFKMYEVSMMDRTAGWGLDYSTLANNNSYYEVFSRNGVAAHILVHPDAQPDFLNLLDANTMNYKIVHNDVGLWLQSDFEMNQKLRNLYPYQGKLGTERYYSHAEINQFIEDLAKQNPTRVEVKTVGKSFEGRWLKTIRITNGDGRANKNVILVDGGFHAREWISPAAVVYGINELVNNYEAHAQLLQDYDWIILPVVNPDGYEYSQKSPNTRVWRKTRQPSSRHCIGIDPNRNFDFHWNEAGTSLNPCERNYAGPKPFSEPETIVVRDLIHSLADRGKMYLTVHSFGSYILYPWGYIDLLPDTWKDLDEVGRAGRDAIKAATGTVYQVGCSTQLLYPAAGASDDYAFNAGFPISFTMELPAGGDNYFDPPPADIDRLVKETWVGIVAMAQKVVKMYPFSGNNSMRM